MTQNALCPSPPPKLQFFVPGTNTPLSGGLLFTYAAGTTTKQNTYANDASTATPNTNPIVLDANGQCVCFLDSTLQYALTLSPPGDTDPPTSPYYTVDNMGYAQMITGLATLSSPTFTGTPAAPNPSIGDNSTKIATTQFVQETVNGGLASPAFTGTPAGPTASPGTLTTQLATTAFVGAEIAKAQQIQAFTNSGTFTIPTGVVELKVRAWGAGGGGGGTVGSSASGGGGGGGGGYVEGVFNVSAITSITVTIGSGGTAGTTGAAGTNGTATTLSGISVSCNGGSGGTAGTSSFALGGAGGSSSGGAINVTGGNGGGGFYYGVGFSVAGVSGTAFSGPWSGLGNSFPGGGGYGAVNTNGASNGASGLVVFEWLAP